IGTMCLCLSGWISIPAEYGGNSNGAECVFPFSYKGHTYYTCTNKFEIRGRYWCATTGSYDKDKQWSFCADTKPASCVFPFKFRNKSYSSCTKEGSFDGQLWCATTPDYDKDSSWKGCSLQEYGGNSNGQPCWFPFTFNNQTFDACTNEDDNGEKNGGYWCSTTPNYDEQKLWSFCADTNLRSGESCVFPFTYNGKSYTSCTSVGTVNWKYWCSLTSNYNTDRQWKYCEPSGRNESFLVLHKVLYSGHGQQEQQWKRHRLESFQFSILCSFVSIFRFP
uniref:Fibronectin type-II domain-containing protein n=1 Tax=Podarcis muralis TaxID=64176 RepID=A0A670JIA6_PODMU